jgi:hypothetical protein
MKLDKPAQRTFAGSLWHFGSPKYKVFEHTEVMILFRPKMRDIERFVGP